MQVEGVTVTKIIEPKLLGVHKTYNVYLCHGKYGEYLRYNSVNYSIPEWAKMENLNEMFNLTHAINIIDWKMKNKVPRGEAGCK
jgi:topoisomerase IA-like protein